ncbi:MULTISPECIES: hypothetical protein [Dyadobacter]|uniref:Uncharacterized protein n=3 Tax=Dyadobacter TaxID=120831 RepID=A0A5R9K6J5_9BACT|nr:MULTISPECIES: hypothetical protein [Dyadobacter]TDE09408.1 hypothetical protein E0F88_30780 [Dyadobacter psychrotolerans]TLU89398.1 hypothetical protein FEM55_21890 [Dyadobacter sediminis]GGC05750.1 hypothetical protein GCM10011325_35810 [Dyadobacter sediminis]SKC20128.1 hypothetical protein SAMN05660293_05600 [Dyadobacter psychrophilus]
MCVVEMLSRLIKIRKNWQLFLLAAMIINNQQLSAQALKATNPPMYFLNTGVFFSPSMEDTYFSPALDVETGFWKMNNKNFFSWGASAEVWHFSSIMYGLNNPTIKNNTDAFINLNGMFYYDNKIITPYVMPTFSFVSDFKDVGIAAGIALGLTHKTSKRLETFIQAKSIRFSKPLNYLNMNFIMIGLSLKLSE